MVSELKDHLLRHLQGVEKKKIEQMVLDYSSKLVGFAFCFHPLKPKYITPSMIYKLYFWRSPILKPVYLVLQIEERGKRTSKQRELGLLHALQIVIGCS